MFSPGQYYKRVPTDLEANLRFRHAVLLAANKSIALQLQLIEACRRDLFFFISVFVWSFNPNHVGDEIEPFIAWDFQIEDAREILASIESGTRADVVIEKSREMGASWLCLIIMLWFFLFHKNKKFLAISRNADAVDMPNDPDCLFWKLDFILAHLPKWLVKCGRQGAVIVRRKMAFRNPHNNSFITGQATTGKAGVGGRCTAMFLDEFGQNDDGDEVLRQTSDTTGCRIFNGTHIGMGTAFYKLCRKKSIKKIVMHWSKHPEKNRGLYRFNTETNQVEFLDKLYQHDPYYDFIRTGAPGGPFPGVRSPWYDDEVKRREDNRNVAMNLDIDPQGAAAQFFDSQMIRSRKEDYAIPPLWEGELHYDRDTGRPIELIPSAGGHLKLWLLPNVHGKPPKGVFALGADVATGSGATPTCFSIGNCETGEKIGEYVNAHIEPISAAALFTALGWLFQTDQGDPARLIWEIPGPGQSFGKKIVELGYRSIYYRTAEFTIAQKPSEMPGWVNNPTNMLVTMEEYRAALAMRQFINRSYKALDETLNFVYVAGGVQHDGAKSEDNPADQRENHGDRVVADAILWKIIKRLGMGKLRPAEKQTIQPGSLAWRRKLSEDKRRAEEAWA